MIRALNIALNAAHPDLPLAEAVAFVSSPTALFVRGVPRRVGKWAITAVSVAMTRPDGSVSTRSAVESPGGVWTVTLPGSPAAGRTAAGLRIYADGEDETGAVVTGYVLGFADLEIKPLSAAPTPAPGTDAHEMWYYDEEPEEPRKGDVCEINGALKYYDGEAWQSFGGGGTSDYDDLSNKPSINDVTLSGNKTAAELGLATAAQGAKADTAYHKPRTGIPATDMTEAVQDIISLFSSISGTPSNIRFRIENGDGGIFGIDEADGTPYLISVRNGQFYAIALPFKSGILALLSDVVDKRDKMDLRVYTYTPWSTNIGKLIWEPESNGYDFDGEFLFLSWANGVWTMRDTEDESNHWDVTAPFDALSLTFDMTGWQNFGILTLSRTSVYSEVDTLAKVSQISGFAPLASPAFTGTPTAPTPNAADNSTKVATTAFVKTAISGISVTPLSGQTFDFATTQGVMDALKATIEALGGTVTNAPTPPAQNNQTQGE